MKALIVHAHENPASFCSALANKAKSTLEQVGLDVELSDLYGMNFNPVGSRQDFKELSDAAYYKYPIEQWHASQKDLFQDDVQREINKLLDADVLIFNFPLWWYSMPAILKGWVDRVLAYGIAYGGSFGVNEKGRFTGRRAFATITTGSPKKDNEEESIGEILRNVNNGIFKYIGYQTLEPFVAYGASRVSPEERIQYLKDYEAKIKRAFS